MDAWHAWVPCNLCGSPDPVVLFRATRSGRQVVRCRGCGLVFYNPQPAADRLAGWYTSEYFQREYPPEAATGQTRLAHRRLARIEQEVRIGHLLDVGCGLGRFLGVARQRGWKATGLDAAPAAVCAAAASGAAVLPGDLLRPRGIPTFDVLTMWDVLEHLLDPVGDLRRARDWLRPGGLIAIQTQNVNSVTSRWMRHRWEQFVEYHLHYFSPRTLRRALEAAGFGDIRIEASERFLRDDPAAPPDPGPTRRSRPGIRDIARRLRDAAFIRAGYDPFTLMVATARFPRER